MLHRLDTNRSLLRQLLHDQLPDVSWTPPQATYLAWPDFRNLRIGDDPAAILLPAAQVALSPGLTYGGDGGDLARLNFGTSPDLLTEMITSIASSDPARTAG